MALIARVSSASTFALFVDTCFFICGYQIAPFFFFHRRRRLRRGCCFGSPSLRVHCGYFFSLSTSGLYRIAHPSLAGSSLCPSFRIIISTSR